jgi:hypothetical protein
VGFRRRPLGYGGQVVALLFAVTALRHAFPSSRQELPELFVLNSPSSDRGCREDRALAGARGPRAAKSTRQNHRLSREHPAFPARLVYGLYAISPGTGFLAPVTQRRVNVFVLGVSTGTPGPRDFAVRAIDSRLLPTRVHRSPHSTYRDDAYVPLRRGGCRLIAWFPKKRNKSFKGRPG